MASALTVLLFGCWLAGRSRVWGEMSYPKPSISISPGGVIPVGGTVTIRCRHQHRGLRILLYKAGDGNYLNYTDPAGSEAEFPITSARQDHGGSYTCRYHDASGIYSEPSDPVHITVAEPSYPKPTITLNPRRVVPLGVDISIQCRGQRKRMRFVLNKDGRYFQTVNSNTSGAEFSISSVSRADGGIYSCSYHSRSTPFNVSSPSDPLELVVRDPSFPRPSISLTPTEVTAPWTGITIRCEGPRRDVRFFLHKAGDRNPPQDTDPAGNWTEFHIPTVGRQHGGNYSCSYRPRSEPFVSSRPSDSVQLVVRGGPDPTQPGVAPAPTRTGSTTGPGGSERPGLAIIIGVSAAATGLLLLLLLLMAFVCFRRTRARKGAAPRPSSTIPLGVLKAPAQQDPIDASVDEGKEPQTLEPDPEGLTYAELDGRALQAKWGAPPPAPRPALYATINVSRGAPQ